MRASWSWSWVLVLAACTEHGSPPDALNLPDCICTPAQLSSDRMTMDFGSITVTSSSPLVTVQVSNVGFSETGSIVGVITGTDAAEFTVQNGCTTLAQNGTCVLAVRFSPMSSGAKTATLVISSSPGGTVSVALTGSAT